MKQRTNIGSSSLLLIFIVLCLVTFGLMSLSNARSDWDLARKNAGAVLTYYDADSQGEEFLRLADRTVKEVWSAEADSDRRAKQLKERLKDFYQEESGTIRTDIPMDFGQVLHIELQFDDEADYRILNWKVYNQDVYDIDDKIPVWTGE